MHFPINKKMVNLRSKTTRGGSVLLLNKIKTKSLPVEISGGAILSNRFVGITSNHPHLYDEYLDNYLLFYDKT